MKQVKPNEKNLLKFVSTKKGLKTSVIREKKASYSGKV